jgi:hypothetical protein
MTIDDLVRDFDIAVSQSKAMNREDVPDKAHRRAGVRRVVEALRDELTEVASHVENIGGLDALDIAIEFNEILGSDAGGAAGGPAREDGRPRGLVHPSGPSSPAADFCEWTRDAEAGAFNPSCDEWSKWTYSDPMDDPESEGYSFCPSCGKPISFKETHDPRT